MMGIQNLAGQTLGQYELCELLGAGGMGAVYKGYQASLGRHVAIKVLPPIFVEQPGFLDRFNREARTLAALEHPHIVRIYDFGTQESIPYLVMHLLGGGTLAQRLIQREVRGEPLPELGTVAETLRQLAGALDYAHSKGVIHRDIKPSNVMYDENGHAYLVDFGIAKVLSATKSLTATGAMLGTPLYMAPEQWRAEEPTPATDQYALGALIYTLLTGQPPFDAPTPFGLMHRHLHDIPTPPDAVRADVPEDVAVALDRALAKAPADRFPNAMAFARTVERALNAVASEDTAESVEQQAGPDPGATDYQFVAPTPRTPAAPAAEVDEDATDYQYFAQSSQPAPASRPVRSAPPQVLPRAGDTSWQTGGPPHPDRALAPPTYSWHEPTVPAPPAHKWYVWMWGMGFILMAGALVALLVFGGRSDGKIVPIITSTRIPAPTATADPYSFARNFTGSNRDWMPVVREFNGVAMVLVPAGCFMMGLTEEQIEEDFGQCEIDSSAGMCIRDGYGANRRAHEVCLSQPFWIDRYEVTNEQFARYGGWAEKPSANGGRDYPREMLSWYEARDFCALRGARLPTEAEWEYAARGPEGWLYPWGNLFVAGNTVYKGNSGGQTANVGSRPGGASWVGALDLSGNVMEWVADWFGPYPIEPQVDPTGPSQGVIIGLGGKDYIRSLRGGSNFNEIGVVRATARYGSEPGTNDSEVIGFRCAGSLE